VGEVTYAEKIEPDDLRLDWSASGEEVGRLVRLERAWTMFRGDRLRVLEVERVTAPGLAPGALDGPVVGTHDGAVRLVRVQPAGRGAMGGADWARGARPADGERFDQGGPGDG
jgi:methionyl-tRNA formyltransferase